MTLSAEEIKNYRRKEELRDGRRVIIRTIRPSDKKALHDGFHRLSNESIHARFFGGKHDLSSEELKFFTELDFKSHVGIVIEVEEDSYPLGVGRFILNSNPHILEADVAITVDENNHGLGVGTHLLMHLAEIAKELGISSFNADLLASNIHMLHIIERLGLPIKIRKSGEFLNVRIILNNTEEV